MTGAILAIHKEQKASIHLEYCTCKEIILHDLTFVEMERACMEYIMYAW
jgi:hypothetical protein